MMPCAVRARGHAALVDHDRVEAEAHRAPLVPDVALLGQEVDHVVGGRGIELRRVGAREPADVARVLDHRALHPEADPEVRDLLLARVADRLDLPLDPAVPEAARDEDPVEPHDVAGQALALDALGVHPHHLDRRLVGDAPVGEGLVEALVRVLHLDVLADHPDAAAAPGRLDPADDLLPAPDVGGLGRQPEHLHDALVQSLVVEGERDLVDRVDVARGDDRLLLDVAEQRDLGLDRRRERVILGRPAQEHVGLDADGAQLLHGMLGGLGLELRRRLDERHERQVDVDDVVLADVLLELAHGLEERQAFDVAHGAADLHDHHVHVLGDAADRGLDLVRDVGNHLHGPPEVVPPALLLDHRPVHLARGDVVVAAHPRGREALVVPEVEVRLAAVVGDVDLAVLIGAHRPGVHVDVRVHLLQRHAEPPRFEERADRGRRQSLAEGGHDATGHEDEFRAHLDASFRAGTVAGSGCASHRLRRSYSSPHGLHAAVEPLAAEAPEIPPDRGTARDAEGDQVLPGQDRPRGAPVPKEPLDATASRRRREEPGTGEHGGRRDGSSMSAIALGRVVRASRAPRPRARHRHRQGAPRLARDRQPIETRADHPGRLAGEQREQREVAPVDRRARGARTRSKRLTARRCARTPGATRNRRSHRRRSSHLSARSKAPVAGASAARRSISARSRWPDSAGKSPIRRASASAARPSGPKRAPRRAA